MGMSAFAINAEPARSRIRLRCWGDVKLPVGNRHGEVSPDRRDSEAELHVYSAATALPSVRRPVQPRPLDVTLRCAICQGLRIFGTRSSLSAVEGTEHRPRHFYAFPQAFGLCAPEQRRLHGHAALEVINGLERPDDTGELATRKCGRHRARVRHGGTL